MNQAITLFSSGILGASLLSNNKENFNDSSNNLSAVIIVIIIFLVILSILLTISSYLLMGGGTVGGINAFLTLFLGAFWICILWLYLGLSGRRCK